MYRGAGMKCRDDKVIIDRADKMMRKRLLLIVCLVVLAGFVGCVDSNRGIEPIIEGEGQFPEFLVGTWRPDESRWVFLFEPDGRISKMTHHCGMEFEVAEGGLVEQWRDDIEAMYALGPCEARYNPKTRELSVRVVIEHMVIEFPNGVMEGNFHDELTGPVSEDGMRWNAAWVSVGEVDGFGSDDPNTVSAKQLTFTKDLDNSERD